MDTLFKKANVGNKISAFKPYKKRRGRGTAFYTDNSKMYIHPTGFLVFTKAVWVYLGSPEFVMVGGWGNGNWAIVPAQQESNETYRMCVGKENVAVRISCKSFLEDSKMIVEGNIVSYPLVISSNTLEFGVRHANWNTMVPPTIEDKFDARTNRRKAK